VRRAAPARNPCPDTHASKPDNALHIWYFPRHIRTLSFRMAAAPKLDWLTFRPATSASWPSRLTNVAVSFNIEQDDEVGTHAAPACRTPPATILACMYTTSLLLLRYDHVRLYYTCLVVGIHPRVAFSAHYLIPHSAAKSNLEA
jgi:hypothetical protein